MRMFACGLTRRTVEGVSRNGFQLVATPTTENGKEVDHE